MSFAVFMLIGPGEITLRRSKDMLDSFWRFNRPDWDIDLYLINDGNQQLDDLSGELALFRQVYSLDNPLTGRSQVLMDRLTAGAIVGWNAVADSGKHYDYILKLDDDALIIGEFHSRLRNWFVDNPHAGKVGTLSHFPDGKPRPGNSTWAPVVKNGTTSSRLWPEFKRKLRGHLPDSAWSHPVRRYLVGRRAKGHGYTDGTHVQGGSYALSLSAITKIGREFRDPLLFNYTGIGEDVAVSLLVKSVGLQLHQYNQPGEVFAVWWRTPTLAPSDLLDRQYAIVHSIKYDDADEEHRIRGYFKAKRHPS